jgi:hypothetical protein
MVIAPRLLCQICPVRKMMNKLILLSIAVLSSGCAPVASMVRLPDGGEGFAVSCSGNMRSWASCYQAAGEKCGARGYDIINKATDSSIDSATRSMLIKCK